MNIKKGDNVIVITGANKGKKGKVLETFNATNRVIVDGVNMKKRHQRPRKSNEKGQILDIAHSVHASNVMLMNKQGAPTRIGKKVVGNKKIRVSTKTGDEV